MIIFKDDPSIQAILFYLIIFGTFFLPSVTFSEDQWSTPSPALSVLERTDQHADGSPYTLHALWIELDHPALEGFIANTPFEAGGLVSEFAQEHDLAAAWNANFFSSMSAPCGVMQGDGVRWTQAYDEYCQGALAISDGSQPQVQMFLQPDARYGLLAPWMRHVVAGAPGFIVDNGSPIANVRCDELGSLEPCVRHARLSMGLDASGRKLLVVTMDQGDASVGASIEEIAQISAKLGAHRAINLCGGSRASLYVRDEGGLINHPSTGEEQPVCCKIGLRIDPHWTMPSPPDPDPDPPAISFDTTSSNNSSGTNDPPPNDPSLNSKASCSYQNISFISNYYTFMIALYIGFLLRPFSCVGRLSSLKNKTR